jgi:serine/threonine protein kinase
MSAVYRATDPNLRRQVAIKLIHTHLSVNPNFVNRFKEEAAAIARLRHPNIVQVYDFDADGETYYMVMEYLIGETLQARLKRLNAVHRRMPYPEVIRLCCQLCDAVGYAHKRELIHRDIKPANIMLDVNGQAILMDFGIVKIVGGEYHTATGATVGTAAYMAPEQIRSERADERSDIYSLGVTLYEMISGRTPYQADSALTVMMMVLNDPLPDLREIRKGVPEALAAVVEKALAKESANRFQTMDDMAAALRQAMEQAASTASVATVVDDEPIEEAASPDPTVKRSGEAEYSGSEPESAEVVQREGRLVEARKPEWAGERLTATPTTKDELIEPIAAPEQVAPSKLVETAIRDHRRFVITAAILLLFGAAIAVGIVYIRSQAAPTVRITPIDWPPGPINAQSARSVVSLGRWETSSFIEELVYYPDGNLIGSANNRESLWLSKYRFYAGIWQADTGNLDHYLLGHTQWVYSVAFSSDGQLFATASDDASVILWHVSDGSQARRIETSMGGIANVDFSPINPLLAAGSSDGNVGLWQVSDGHLLRTLAGHEDSVTDVEFSPDGRLLASASDDHTVKLWQISDGSLIHTLRSHTAPVRRLAFSPDGTWLASASGDDTIGMWQVSDGSLIRRLQGHSGSVLAIDFSSDGSVLASGSEDETLRLWAVTDGSMLRILTEHSNAITSVAFSTDSRTLVSGATDGVLLFWGLSEAIPLETELPAPETATKTPSAGD